MALNIRREVLGFGIQTTTDETSWNIVWQRYITASSVHEKHELLYSLCQTTQLTLVDRLVVDTCTLSTYTKCTAEMDLLASPREALRPVDRS